MSRARDFYLTTAPEAICTIIDQADRIFGGSVFIILQDLYTLRGRESFKYYAVCC